MHAHYLCHYFWVEGRSSCSFAKLMLLTAGSRQSRTGVSHPPHPGHRPTVCHNSVRDSRSAKPMLLLRVLWAMPVMSLTSPCPFLLHMDFLTWQHHAASSAPPLPPQSPSHPFSHFRSSPAASLPNMLSIHGNEHFHSSSMLKEFFFQNRLAFFFF